MNYYNDFDPHSVAWLKQLIADGLIPPGDVDGRSIKEVQPSDLQGYDQCHFFAGIAGWPLGLALAGQANRSVWTGSCPCQPYSSAGKQKGDADERNLWPDFFRLIRECRPDVVFGEQVESAIRHGWLDGIQRDLEGEAYAVGHCVLGAHSVGAPHIRQRLFWVADASSQSSQRNTRGLLATQTGVSCADGTKHGDRIERLRDGCAISGLADTGAERLDGRPCLEGSRRDQGERSKASSDAGFGGGLGQPPLHRDRPMPLGRSTRQGETEGRERQSGGSGASSGVGLADGAREGEIGCVSEGMQSQCSRSPWSDFSLVKCRDEKHRRIERGTFPLVARLPGDVVPSGDPSLSYVQATPEARTWRLKGYGNAIVPQLAAEFIDAFYSTKEIAND